MCAQVVPTPLKTAADVPLRHVVTAATYAGSHALDRDPDIGEFEVDDFQSISGHPPTAEARQVAETAERAFEGKVLVRLGEAIQL